MRPQQLQAFSAGDGMPSKRDMFLLAGNLLTDACTASQTESKARRPCKTVRLTKDQAVIHVAATYGTNPLILQRDNPQLDRLVRAISVTAVGLLALKKGSTLAVRPAEGDECKRWNPSGQPRAGPLDAKSFPRPCWGFARNADKNNCYCSYHRSGTFVLPGSNCQKVITCAHGQAAKIATCKPGWFASDISEVSGHATCYREKDRIGDFVCGDGCASMVCFCAEHLVHAFSPGGSVYLNPFDASFSTALICDVARRGWFGGIRYPPSADKRRKAARFNPVTKAFGRYPAATFKGIVARKMYSSCEGVPYWDESDFHTHTPKTSPRKGSPRKGSPAKTKAIDIKIRLYPHGVHPSPSPRRHLLAPTPPPTKPKAPAPAPPQNVWVRLPPYWKAKSPSKACTRVPCCGDYPAAARANSIFCPKGVCRAGVTQYRRWYSLVQRKCGAAYVGACPYFFHRKCRWDSRKLAPKALKGTLSA